MKLKKEIINFKNWMFERYGISIANHQVNEYLLAKYNITDKLTETQKRVLAEKNNENSGLHKHFVSGSLVTCGDCNQPMTHVRPGKYQCDNPDCSRNQ